jgi:hypothetical protein
MNNEILKNASEEICKTARQMVGPMPAVAAEWNPLRAPGFVAGADKDARQVHDAFSGWSKLAVSSKYEDIGNKDPKIKIELKAGTGKFLNYLQDWVLLPLPAGESGEVSISRDQLLPDQWAFDRNYHHAWYFKNHSHPMA